MSVINRVLKDLDRMGVAPGRLVGVRAVPARRLRSRPLWVLVFAAAAATWWFWPASLPRVQKMPRPPEVRPRLRLSETLSVPTNLEAHPPERGAEQAGSLRYGEVPTRPEAHSPERGAGQAGSLRYGEVPTRPEAHSPERGAGQAGSLRYGEVPIKLDSHLPEPRPARVSKEVRPLSVREQAEQAWAQAARLIEQGRGREALEALEALLRLDASHGPARQALVALSLEGGDAARAEALLREGLLLHPRDAWYSRSLGQLSLQRGDTAGAAAFLKAGLGKGVDAGYWGLYGGVLEKAGHAEEATHAYREAARMDSGHGPWWVGLAVTLEQTGSRAEAAQAYRRALQTHLGADIREFVTKKTEELAKP